MEMTYGGALVMPSSYAMMDEEEMMYLEGATASNWVSYSSVSYAYSYHCNAGTFLQIASVALGVCSSIRGLLKGAPASIAGALAGCVLGTVVGCITGTIVWNWGAKFHDCANELYRKKGTSAWTKSCKIKWDFMGLDIYYQIKY